MSGLEPIGQALASLGDSLRTHPGFEVATLFLGGVFLWSGIAKLRAPALAAIAMVDFGVVRHSRPWLGAALGSFEVALGVALMVGLSLDVVLAITTVTVAIFTGLVAKAWIRSEKVSCFCFGGDEQISGRTVARNLALLALAVALLTSSTGSAQRLEMGEQLWLSLIVAGAALGAVALIARVPSLWRWNWEVRDYFSSRARACQK